MNASQPLAKQIGAINLIQITGLVALAVLAIASTLLLRSTFTEYRTAARLALSSNAVFEDIFEMRVSGLKWRSDPEPQYLVEFEDNLADLRTAEEEFSAINGADSALVSAIQVILPDVEAYAAEFERYQQATAQLETAQAEADAAAEAASAALKEVAFRAVQIGAPETAYRAEAAHSQLLGARFLIESFQRTGDSEGQISALAEINGLLQGIGNAAQFTSDAEIRSSAEAALRSAEAFLGHAEAVVDGLATQRASRVGLNVLGPTMVHDVEKVVEQSANQQNTIGPRAQAIMFWAVVTICVFALVILSLGWTISRRVAGRISGEIEDAVMSMSQIADGNLDADVPSSEFDNEIGRMAQALEVFKANGKAAIEAVEREKEAERLRLEEADARKREQEEQEAKAREQAEEARNQMVKSLSSSVGLVVSAASEGDFSRRVDASFEDVRLAALAQNINKMVTSVEQGVSATAATLSRVANGDLTKPMDGAFQGAFAELQNDTNAMILSLKSLIADISASCQNLASSSGELRQTSSTLSSAAESNAASLQESSAALEELNASITQVSQNVADANDHAKVARETAESSSEVALAAADAMTRISEASNEIAEVVKFINDIAFQINLLALNAGVEAARAGDAGRGFSVVASEVRDLSQRASDAAKEIEDVIARSKLAVSEGEEKVADAQVSLSKISESVVGVSERIAEVSHAISEQVHGTGEISIAVGQVDQNTQRQVASFEEVTAASALLSDEAAALKASASRFNIGGAPASATSLAAQAPKKEIRQRAPLVTEGNLAIVEDGFEDF